MRLSKEAQDVEENHICVSILYMHWRLEEWHEWVWTSARLEPHKLYTQSHQCKLYNKEKHWLSRFSHNVLSQGSCSQWVVSQGSLNVPLSQGSLARLLLFLPLSKQWLQVLSCTGCVLRKFKNVSKQSPSERKVYALQAQLSQLMCVKGCLTYVSRNARLEQKRIAESVRNVDQTSKCTFEVSSKLRSTPFEVSSKLRSAPLKVSKKFVRNFFEVWSKHFES